MPQDGAGRLSTHPFTHRVTADGRVFIHRDGRQVAVVAGRTADRLVAALTGADEDARQQTLTRVTGNYRRGNERSPR